MVASGRAARVRNDGLHPESGDPTMTRAITPVFTAALLVCGALAQTGDGVATIRIDVTPGHALNSFDPDRALGSSIDVLSRTGIDKVYTPHIIQEALSAGWGPITYRNNTELRMAAWHWTPNGTWSDP